MIKLNQIKDYQQFIHKIYEEISQNNQDLAKLIKSENKALNLRLDRIEERIGQIIASQQYQR